MDDDHLLRRRLLGGRGAALVLRGGRAAAHENGDRQRDEERAAADTPDDGADDDDEGADEKVGGKVLAPAARKMVAEHDLDVSKIEGTGKGGRILKEDVQKAVKDGSAKKAAKSSAPAKAAAAPAVEGERAEKRVPMSRLRQTIAKRLVQAQQTAAMLTTYNEVDMGAVMSLRAQYKDTFLKAHDTKLGFMGFFAKAACLALKDVPAVNAYIEGDEIVYHDYVDISVAVSAPNGLVVPVIRDAQDKGFARIEKDIADFGKRAKEGTLTMEDMKGGTFTWGGINSATDTADAMNTFLQAAQPTPF